LKCAATFFVGARKQSDGPERGSRRQSTSSEARQKIEGKLLPSMSNSSFWSIKRPANRCPLADEVISSPEPLDI
jgi:hypothetical protein